MMFTRDPSIEPIFSQELDDHHLGNNRGSAWIRKEVEATIVGDETAPVENVQIQDFEKDPQN